MPANEHRRAPFDPVVESMVKLQKALQARGVRFNAINWTQGHVDLVMQPGDVDRLAEALTAHYVPNSRLTSFVKCESCCSRDKPANFVLNGVKLCFTCYHDAISEVSK